jgi:shikimate dehydrogenase
VTAIGRITGATRVAAVVGHPIAHSLSPVLHNAAFAAAELDWVFTAFPVGPGGGAGAVSAMRALHVAGLSVTMPLKEEVAAAVDVLAPEAEALGAVNTVVADGPRVVGHNTDGGGFLDALRLERAWSPEGRRCLVVGAGGAARAVIRALADGRAEEIVVVNRTGSRAEAAAALAGAIGRVGTAGDAAAVELVVNATPAGMKDVAGGDASFLDAVTRALPGVGQVVVDLVYHPRRTAFLEAAQQRGAAAIGGLGMLIHQAARAFELWTGVPAPVEAMAAAASAVLGGPEGGGAG